MWFMIIFKKINRSFITILIISLSVFLFSKCISEQDKSKAVDNIVQYSDFAGSASCASCHKDIYEGHINTGHYNTSQPASENKILGSFEQEHNTFSFNTLSKVVMEKREDGYYQVEYLVDREGRKGRFDVTVGSGKKRAKLFIVEES